MTPIAAPKKTSRIRPNAPERAPPPGKHTNLARHGLAPHEDVSPPSQPDGGKQR